MSRILIKGRPARTVQEVASAACFNPELVGIASDPETDNSEGEAALLDLKPGSQVQFTTDDCVMAQLHVGFEGICTVETIRKNNTPEAPIG